MKPFHSFTIQADDSTYLRYRVIVWRNYSQLQVARRRAAKISKDKRAHQDCDGFCHKFQHRHQNDLVIGAIHFCKEKLSLNTIAHEAVHAAVNLAAWERLSSRDKGKKEDNERDLCVTERIIDEAIAYSTGYITEGIVLELRRQKFKIKPL